MRHGNFDPGLLPHPESARFIDCKHLQGALLQPDDRVTGLRTTDDYDTLERFIISNLQPHRGNVSDERFLEKPLSSQLRPAGFNGDLIGQAIVLPSTSSRTKDLPWRQSRNKSFVQFDAERRLVIVADMYSTSVPGQALGRIIREVIYVRREHKTDEGYIKRRLGSDRWLQEAATIVQALNKSSDELATLMSALAVKQVLPGGLPGLGKQT